MEIQILGTAAAEGWPAVFCGCETCRSARETGGENIRSRASIQFGAQHRIDLPPDTWFHEAHEGADLSKLEHLFITHSHRDHWSPPELGNLIPPFAHGRSEPLKVHGNNVVTRQARELSVSNEGTGLVAVEVEPFVPIQAGNMAFTPIRASHMLDEDEVCVNYVASSGDRTVLYACDTGWYPEDTWEFLEATRLDAVISECTSGPHDGGKGHLNFEGLFAMKERLEQSGTISAGGVFVATHFSHNVGLLHKDLEYILGKRQILAAYDGMQISL